MDLGEILDGVCRPVGTAGREDEVREHLIGLLKPHAVEMEVDRLGNLQVWLTPRQKPLVMLDAHMDEVGLVVQRVDAGGLLKVAPVGGIDPRLMPGSRLIVQPRPGRRLPAVVGLAPPHVETAEGKDKVVPWEKLLVDTGLGSAEAVAEAGVEVGSVAVMDAGQGLFGDGCFMARNLDDRVGCTLMAALALALKGRAPESYGLVLNFAVAEEVGLRGAGPAAFGLDPDLCLCLESTMADTPGLAEERQPSRMGGGPAVTVMDGRIIVPWRLVESLEAAARDAGVACQRKLPPYGGTDAGAIHTSRAGVPTAVLSVPTRYLHGPVSFLKLADLDAAYNLLLSWLNSVEDLL